ncbi:MAG: EpsG family protein, partial [Sphingomonadaceae bacterium]
MTLAGVPRRDALRRHGLSPGAGLSVLVAGLLAMASGYRWFGEGRDYGDYLIFWSDIGSISLLPQSRFEPGFTWMAWAFKNLGADYGLFASFLVLVSLGIKFAVFYRQTRWPLAAVACYLGMFFFVHEYTQLRMAVALAFALLAAVAFGNGRWINAGLGLL